MDIVLRSTERMAKMQVFIARKFMLQPERRYDIKHTNKTAQT
jgi:hypothetical protein